MTSYGMLALRRPLGGLTHLRQFDPHISDLVGVIVGAKPVLYMDIAEGDWPYVRRLCAAFDLKHYLPEPIEGKVGFHHDGGKRMLLLGKDEAVLSQAAECWGRSKNGVIQWGSYLGYPECCVRAYGDWRAVSLAQPLDIVRRIYADSESAGPFSFMLNNVVNYYSRIDPKNDADRKRYAAMMHLSAIGVDVGALHVVSWHPCSFHCPETAAKARAILVFFEENLPQWARLLKTYLANPIVYFDKYEFVALRGRVVSPGIVESRGVLPPYSLLPIEIVRALNRGRRIEVEGAGLLVDPGEMRLEHRGKKPLLLDFGATA